MGRRRRGSRARRGATEGGYEGLTVICIGLFILASVGGFAWAQDRELRGGLLSQRLEAAARPDWVALRSVPEHVREAFVAVIDPTFLDEGALRTGETGTTLARELAAQIHLLPSGLMGDAREMAMGPLLEQRLTKRALLELYLNRVYLGRQGEHPIYGIYHASRDYFSKDPADLTLGEAATLAGLLLPPRIEEPDRSVGAVGARRNEVLQVLWIGDVITDEEYSRAVSERLSFQPGLTQQPMTRPADWAEDPEVIHIPADLLLPDTTEANDQ